jgi:hypothetical protein
MSKKQSRSSSTAVEVSVIWLTSLNAVIITCAAGIAAGDRLHGWGSVPSRDKRFSLLHSVQTGSGAHPASYPTGTGALSPGDRAAGTWRWSLTSI